MGRRPSVRGLLFAPVFFTLLAGAVAEPRTVAPVIKDVDQDWAKGSETTYDGRLLGDGLAHFGSDQLREVTFYIVARFTSNAGCALGFGMAALMRL